MFLVATSHRYVFIKNAGKYSFFEKVITLNSKTTKPLVGFLL